VDKKRQAVQTSVSILAARIACNVAITAEERTRQNMRFLLRMAFWLTIILALLPSGGSQPTPKVNVSAVDAVSAAKATVSDVRSFCERQPEACTVGSQAAVAIGNRAQAGAKMLYEYLNERLGSHDARTPLNAASGEAVRLPTARPSQHTLSPSDLAPAWHAPQSRKDGPA
jgi:hypothetical protein